MAGIEDLFSRIPVDQIAGMLGVDAEQVQQAAGKAVPALVEGMQANAQDPAGAASLERALSQHGGELDGELDAATIDTDDGAKIVKNVFGDNVDGVAHALSGGAGASLIQKVLPMVAPLVMGFLSKQASGGAANAAAPQGDGGIDVGSLLGGLLGGGKR